MKRLILLWILSLAVCDAYRILTIFPIPNKSHTILGNGLIRHLLAAGHEVTHITPFVKRDPHENLTVVDVSDNLEIVKGKLMDIKVVINKDTNIKSIDFLNDLCTRTSIRTMENPNVLKLLKDPTQQFDLVIAEWMFSEMYSVVPPVFGAPLIWVSTIDPHAVVMSLIDESLHPAYNADETEPPFTFMERVENLGLQIYAFWLKAFKYYNREDEVYRRLIVPILKEKGKPVPTLQELKYNASLMLGNSHPSIGSPTRLPVNYIPVAGYHIEENPKPLPEDLKKIMDESKNGVIYFSMGTNMHSNDLPEDMKKGLLDEFGALKQTVIWKFEDVLPNAPENVHISPWAPQQSILAHPNCVLFITHCGLLSLVESVNHGIPIIAVPAVADQLVNAARAVSKGFGLQLDLNNNLHKEIGPAIKEILGNPKYAQKAKEVSFMYHDRPVTPEQEILHWVNHVIKTKGAPHLKSHALLVPMYQKLYLDLIAFLVVGLVLLKRMVQYFLNTLNVTKSNSKKYD